MRKKNTLNWLGLAVSLTTLHYGLGFLIGSGEAIYITGSIGILYAISTALGIISLLLISKFYFKNKYPIWILMAKNYGKRVGESITLLSSIWMIGVVSSQVLGGASVLNTFGINNQVSILAMAVLITVLSLLNLNKLVTFFTFMLLISTLGMILILSFFGYNWIWLSTFQLVSDINKISLFDITGILLPTVIVTFIGMDFHQFIVKSKSRDISQGIILSAFILIIISILLLALINAAGSSNMLTNLKDTKQVVPIILTTFGNGFSPVLGFILTVPIILVAIGSGSGVNRIVNNSVTSSKVLPSFFTKKPNVFVLVFVFVVLISLSGESIISLIVSFYSLYVGSVFIPFLAFLLDKKYKLRLKRSSVELSILGSVVSMLLVFALSYLPDSFITGHKTTYMLSIGFFASLLILVIGNRKKLRILSEFKFSNAKSIRYFHKLRHH